MTSVIVSCSHHFADLALNEIRRHHPEFTLLHSVSPFHLFLRSPGTFSAFVSPWHNRPPIYMHHAFPVHHQFPLYSTAKDFLVLRQQIHRWREQEFNVQAAVYGEYAYASTTLEQSIKPGQPTSRTYMPEGRVISILVSENQCYLGISWATESLSVFPFGKPCFDEPVPNRAGLKLLEAMSVFGVQVRVGDHILDLGASPGAWTEVLRRRGARITAVAPRSMYDWLQADPNVRHFHMTAEDYLPICGDEFDMIVNDMKLDPRDSARLMVQFAKHLRFKGSAIMTLKLRSENRRRVMDHTFRILRQSYKIVLVRQLVSNRKEVTLYLRHNC